MSQNSLFIGKHFFHNDFKMISKRFQNDFMPCKSVREAIIRLSNGLFTFFGNYFLLFGNYFSLFWELFFIFDGERLCKSFLLGIVSLVDLCLEISKANGRVQTV